MLLTCPDPLVTDEYYTAHQVHGGKGLTLGDSSGSCYVLIQAKVDATAADSIPSGADSRFFSGTGASTDVRQTQNIYNESGRADRDCHRRNLR